MTDHSSCPVIVHLTTLHEADDARVFYKECKSLKRAGYDVRLIACAERDTEVDGIPILALPPVSGRMRRMLGLWRPALRKVLSMRPRPRMVHFHDPELLPLGMLRRLIR